MALAAGEVDGHGKTQEVSDGKTPGG